MNEITLGLQHGIIKNSVNGKLAFEVVVGSDVWKCLQHTGVCFQTIWKDNVEGKYRVTGHGCHYETGKSKRQRIYVDKVDAVSGPDFSELDLGVVADWKGQAQARKAASEQEKVAEDSSFGFPELKGTPRQVAWARDIRAKYAKNPKADMKKARKITAAKWWIDHRSEL